MSTLTDTRLRWQRQMADHVECLSVSAAGQVAAGSLSGESVVLSIEDGTILATPAEHPFGVLTVSWSRDADRLAVGGQDGRIRIYDGAGGAIADREIGGWAAASAWSPDDDLLAVAAGKRVFLIECDGSVRAEWPALTSTVTSLVWATNGRRVGAGCYGGVTWYDPDEPETETRNFAWKGSVLALAAAPSGRWLASGNQDNSVHVWRLWSGDEMEMTGYPGKVTRLGFDASSRWLAVASAAGVTVWDFAGKGPQGRRPSTLDRHDGEVTALAWHPTEPLLATGGADGNVAIWSSGKRFVLEGLVGVGDGTVSSLGWAPGSQTVVAASSDGTVAAVERAP